VVKAFEIRVNPRKSAAKGFDPTREAVAIDEA
jgi:hypothetical protein